MAGHENNKPNQDKTEVDGEIVPSDENADENICEEYEVLDSKLDELNSALDFLEQKNDDIHQKLKELLQSNIDIRQQLQNDNSLSTTAH